MKQIYLFIITIFLAILEVTLFNFVAFSIPIVLCFLLFIMGRERYDEALLVAAFGGLALDLLSDGIFGIYIIYFVTVGFLLRKEIFNPQIFTGTFLGFLIYGLILFIFFQLSFLPSLKFENLQSLVIAIFCSGVITILLHTKLYLKNEHI